MTRPIPWARIVAEGLVIVASILLALAADAWWEDRGTRQRERAALEGLESEFERLTVELEGQLAFADRLLAGMETILAASDPANPIVVVQG